MARTRPLLTAVTIPICFAAVLAVAHAAPHAGQAPVVA